MKVIYIYIAEYPSTSRRHYTWQMTTSVLIHCNKFPVSFIYLPLLWCYGHALRQDGTGWV